MSSGIISSKNSRNLLAVVGDFPFVEIAIFTFPWSRYHPNNNRIIQSISNIADEVSISAQFKNSFIHFKIVRASNNHMPFLEHFFLKFFIVSFTESCLLIKSTNSGKT
jgi:hypothetical protein